MESIPSSSAQAVAVLKRVEVAELEAAQQRWYSAIGAFTSRFTRKSHNPVKPSISSITLPQYNPRLDRNDETVLYLAYGSNLASETFRGKRNIKPLSATNVVVPSLQLVFDLPGLPYMEPCFANTRFRSPFLTEKTMAPSDNLWSEKAMLLATPATSESQRSATALGWHKGLVGVVYEVTKTDYAHIIATEGGGASYADIEIECFPLPKDTRVIPEKPDGESIKVHTLFAPAGGRLRNGKTPDGWAQPSARYLGLLTAGAEEHQIPDEYKEWLFSLHAYKTTTQRQMVGKALFAAMWMPLLLALITLQPAFADENGKAPTWLVALIDNLFKAMWYNYDHMYKAFFGDGERTIGDKYDGQVV